MIRRTPASATVYVNRRGVSYLFILFVVFLVLKLTRNIDWSWWWVTAPLWGPFAAGLSFLLLGGFLTAIFRRRSRRRRAAFVVASTRARRYTRNGRV